MLGSQRYCILCLKVKLFPLTFHNRRTDNYHIIYMIYDRLWLESWHQHLIITLGEPAVHMFVWGPFIHVHKCNSLYLKNSMADGALNQTVTPFNPRSYQIPPFASLSAGSLETTIIIFIIVLYKQVGSLSSPPYCIGLFHYITAYIHNVHAIQVLIVNRSCKHVEVIVLQRVAKGH